MAVSILIIGGSLMNFDPRENGVWSVPLDYSVNGS